VIDDVLVDPELTNAFIGAMGTMASGVTIVATDGVGGRFAQTVSAMCSVSAQPPMLLVCLHGRSPANAAIVDNGGFSVNVLATQHDHVADTFAGRPWAGKEAWDFTCGTWQTSTAGYPELEDAVAVFTCENYEVIQAGTHKVYIGRVTSVITNGGVPLLYAERQYRRPERFNPSVFDEFPDAHPSY
jgi:flavin reductase